MTTNEFIAGMMDNEFHGPSYNGEAFLPQLRALSFDQARDDRTWEGYTAAGLAYHTAFWKYALLEHIADEKPAPPPFSRENFPPLPRDFSPAIWEDFLSYLSGLHDALVAAVKKITPATMASAMPDPDMNCSVEQYLLWLPGHDAYHCAQIRSMGIEGLREAR